MCGAWNSHLSDEYTEGEVRWGGTVTTEQFGHSIFDLAIADFDPQAWLAVQQAEANAYESWVADNTVGHERDMEWNCHTAATEYYAAGVELLLYNVRVGEQHKAKTRNELKTQDPALWCLALRHYELNNKYTPCPSGPAITDVTQDVDCKATLRALGVTIFGPDGSNGAKGGGAKIDASLIIRSNATCPVSPTLDCAAYTATTATTVMAVTTTVSETTVKKNTAANENEEIVSGAYMLSFPLRFLFAIFVFSTSAINVVVV